MPPAASTAARAAAAAVCCCASASRAAVAAASTSAWSTAQGVQQMTIHSGYHIHHHTFVMKALLHIPQHTSWT
jgi:hypothetical protein